MHLLVLCAAFPLIFGAQITSKPCHFDYYWRDYYGKLPADAVVAGYLPSGKPFYIGQVYIDQMGIVPGNIYVDRPLTKTNGHTKVFETDKNVKILCSPYRNKFEWISIRSEDLSRLTNTHIVNGGTELGQALYIGRVFDQNSLIVGKVFNHVHKYKGNHVASANGHEASYLAYEILTYNCSDVSVVTQ